jgi:hypothetical protein
LFKGFSPPRIQFPRGAQRICPYKAAPRRSREKRARIRVGFRLSHAFPPFFVTRQIFRPAAALISRRNRQYEQYKTKRKVWDKVGDNFGYPNKVNALDG